MFRGVQSPILLSRLLSEPSLISSAALVIVQVFESAASHSSELSRQGRLRRSERIWNRLTGWNSDTSNPGGARWVALVLLLSVDGTRSRHNVHLIRDTYSCGELGHLRAVRRQRCRLPQIQLIPWSILRCFRRSRSGVPGTVFWFS